MDSQQLPSDRQQPYPPLTPYRTGRLAVSDLHEIYFEECGNPDGIPVAIVHGGPGGGSNPFMRRFHDPERYRIVLFDQRGCGRSTPHAELRENTTWDLIADMERLREHLGISTWQLFGGSWGATLSLAYAINHPQRVRRIILRGVFLMRRAEVEWFYQDGCSRLFPDAYADFSAQIPLDEHHDMVAAYHRRLTSADRATRIAAAKAWSVWEGRTLSVKSSANRTQSFSGETFALAFARIEAHYFQNRGFFDRDDYILGNVSAIRAIPTAVVHGRFDVVTPLANSWALKNAFPELELTIIDDAGHAMTEPGIVDALIRTTRAFGEAI